MRFILGGRMGDLVHMLYVVKNTPGKHDLFITDKRELHSDGFIYNLDQTILELMPVVLQQEYINSVNPYNNEDAVNLNMWRRYAYSASWTNLLSKTFEVPVNPYPWIKVETDPSWEDKIVIHCSTPEPRKGNWDGIDLSDSIFCGSEQEYANFNRSIPFFSPKTLRKWFIIINSCKLFIGNQSLPLAIAHSLDKKRIGVLNDVDKAAYIGEEKIFKNFSYVL